MRVLAAASLLAVPLAALAVEPGSWELSASTVLTGQPQPAAMTQTRCLTEADARDPSRVLGGAAGCEFSNRSDSGGVFTFDVRCGGLLPIRGKGKLTYTARTLEGELDLAAEGGVSFSMQTFLKGRRLGPC